MDKKEKILFVDDNESLLSALQYSFESDEFEVLTARSGDNALSILAKIQDCHVIVADYRMPVMDGITFFTHIKKDWPTVIRILMSGHKDADVVVPSIRSGVVDKYFSKPVDHYALHDSIKKLSQIKSAKELPPQKIY